MQKEKRNALDEDDLNQSVAPSLKLKSSMTSLMEHRVAQPAEFLLKLLMKSNSFLIGL